MIRYPRSYWFRAFANMGSWLRSPFSSPSLQFQKLMGTSKQFGLLPDFSTYIFLAVWPGRQAADDFFASPEMRKLTEPAEEVGTLYLQSLQGHGQWSGQDPFPVQPAPQPPDAAPIVVLTRATVRWRSLVDFWSHVSGVNEHLKDQPDLLYAIGAGEVPLVQPCTLSVWKNVQAIEQFAYRQKTHQQVIRRTRERKWYSEQLFARFALIQAEGTFGGRSLSV